MSWPPTMELSSTPPIIGASCSPELVGLAEGTGDDRYGHCSERQVDVENPPPGEMVDEEAAEHRSKERGKSPDGSEQALVPAALARRYQIADRGDHRHHQAAAPDSLQKTESDELGHAPAHAAERGSGQKHHDRAL